MQILIKKGSDPFSKVGFIKGGGNRAVQYVVNPKHVKEIKGTRRVLK